MENPDFKIARLIDEIRAATSIREIIGGENTHEVVLAAAIVVLTKRLEELKDEVTKLGNIASRIAPR